MTRRRLLPNERKTELIEAALKLAERPGGWSKLTRRQVAEAGRCTEGLVSMHFGTMTDFRRSIMRAAIVRENLSIIGQGIASGDPTANKAPSPLKTRALSHLAG